MQVSVIQPFSHTHGETDVQRLDMTSLNARQLVVEFNIQVFRPPISAFLPHHHSYVARIKNHSTRAPGWLHRLSVRLLISALGMILGLRDRALN